MWILWTLIGVLWTIVAFGVGCYSGIYGERERVKKLGSTTYDQTVLHGPAGPVGNTGATGPQGEPGPPGPPGPPFDLSTVVADPSLGLALPDWIASVNSRLTRVERKAGLNV